MSENSNRSTPQRDTKRKPTRQEEFLRYNDRKYKEVREKHDEALRKKRELVDKRIREQRKKAQQRIATGDKEAAERLAQRNKLADEQLRQKRKRQDARRKQHRKKADAKKERFDKFILNYISEYRIKHFNRNKKKEKNKKAFYAKKIVRIVAILVVLFAVFMAFEIILPGSKMKKEGVIDDTPIEEKMEILPEKEYYVLDNISEDQQLWNLLMDHFDGNKTAVLGVMCNLKSESRFEARNLEDYNNQLWNIDDDTYTEKVNRQTIDKNDFLQSRESNLTNGYYNKYNQWVNTDGGYGYAQFTSFEKKEELYQFAEQWFGPGGEGEGYKFNIGDATMQAHFVVHLLESDEFKNMDAQIRNASTVVDACYIWLKTYEIPYDPYGDGYFTLAFDRASSADAIKAACDK